MKRGIKRCLSRLSWTLGGILAAIAAFKAKPDHRNPSPFLPMDPVEENIPESGAEQPPVRRKEVEISSENAAFEEIDDAAADPSLVDGYPESPAGASGTGSPVIPRRREYEDPVSWSDRIRHPIRIPAMAAKRSAYADGFRAPTGTPRRSHSNSSREYRDAPYARASRQLHVLPRRAAKTSQAPSGFPSPPRGTRMAVPAHPTEGRQAGSPKGEGRQRAISVETSRFSKAISHLKSIFENRSWDGRKSGLHGGLPGSSAVVAHRGRGEASPSDKKSASHPPTSPRSASKRLRPPGMREILGKEVLKPPTGNPSPPDFSKLQTALSQTSRDGKPIRSVLPTPDQLEDIKPPSVQERADKDRFLHAGPAWGVRSGDHWVWTVLSAGHWWTLAQGNQPLLWHAEHWWWKTPDGWFLLHDGQPWAFRQFDELKTEGLVHAASGTRVVYSSDGRRAAILNPDGGTVVYDLGSGKEIGRWRKKSEPTE